jgi:hypothetical protein
MKRVLVLGGYGVFGSLIARELVSNRVHVTIAGRDGAKAKRFAAALEGEARGADVHAVALDACDKDACLKVFREHEVVVHAAGPFSAGETAVLEACLQAGCHYVDIADDRAYAAAVRLAGRRFRDAGLAAVYGCSSLPGISGALASRLKAENPSPPDKIRITLFIGNRNPKGDAAVRSAFRVLGKPIEAPQGTIRGFGDPEIVRLPGRWGERRVFNFESPEYDLFPPEFGAASVSVKLGFESKSATRLFAFLARLPKGLRKALRPALVRMGNAAGRFGTSGGAVIVEFFLKDGSVQRAAGFAPEQGQRMAILPAVSAVKKLLAGSPSTELQGAMTAYRFLGEAALDGIAGA